MNDSVDSPVLQQLVATLTVRWRSFPEPQASQLRERLSQALAEAEQATPEVITVAGTTTHPMVLRLAVLAKASTDDYYSQEWVEFSVAAEGGAWVVYRRRDNQHYAAPWSEGTALPEGLLKTLDPCLVLAVYGGGGG